MKMTQGSTSMRSLTFPFGRDLEQILGQIVFIRVKTLRNTNLVASRHIKEKKRVDVRRSKASLLKLPTADSPIVFCRRSHAMLPSVSSSCSPDISHIRYVFLRKERMINYLQAYMTNARVNISYSSRQSSDQFCSDWLKIKSVLPDNLLMQTSLKDTFRK